MRRHAKASSVESLRGAIGARAIFGSACLAALALVALLVFDAPRAGAVGEPCANAAIRAEQGSSYLPECRAYEQVSPVDKNGSDIGSTRYTTQSSVHSGTVAFISPGAFADNGSLQARGTYVATRDRQAGWQTAGVDPIQTIGEIGAPGYGMQALSPDLSKAFLIAGDPQPAAGAEPGGNNLFVRKPNGAYSLVTPFATPYNGSSGCRGVFAGASRDFSTVIFESSSRLTSDAPVDDPGGCKLGSSPSFMETNLYQWVDGQGPASLRLVGMLPDPDGPGPEISEPAPEGAVAGGMNGVTGIGNGDGASGSTDTRSQNSISEDGSRIFWTSIAPPGNGERQLYVRINGSETVAVSKSQRTPADAPADANFLYATPDGRYAFFSSKGRLTNDSTAGALGADLYRYDLDTGELIDLAPSTDPGAPAAVQGILGASDDGQVVYFAADGHLAAGSAEVPDVQPGSDPEYPVMRSKIYVWDHGTLRFIATLEGPSEGDQVPGIFTPNSNWAWNAQNMSFSGTRSSRVTTDGRYLMFRASLPVDAGLTAPFAQLYRFDLNAADGVDLVCVSCLPGESNTSPAWLNGEEVGTSLMGSIRVAYLSRPLLADGRVIFETAHALVPQDTNGKFDVYLWSEQAGAQLISSGQSPFDSFFADASPDGTDVYFTTRERLVGTDADANIDLYSARSEGGFPEPPAPSPPCIGEACQAKAPRSPGAPDSASEAIAGPGNASGRRPKTRCTKNQRSVKKRGKTTCVKKRGKSKAKKKASANKQHGKHTATNRRG